MYLLFSNIRFITLGVYFIFGKGITFVNRRKFRRLINVCLSVFILYNEEKITILKVFVFKTPFECKFKFNCSSSDNEKCYFFFIILK